MMRTPFLKPAIGLAGLALVLALSGLSSPSGEVIAIRGGRIFMGTPGILDHGVIIIRDGIIQEIGPDAAIPPDARVIEAPRSFIVPGFIDTGTNLGTVEIETVERDDDEPSSPVNPQLRALDAFNPGNRWLPEAWTSGITSILVRPSRGSLLSGQSAFIRLVGTPDLDALAVKPVAAVHGSLGDVLKPRSKQNQAYPYTRMGAAALLRQTLADAKHDLDPAVRAQGGTKAVIQPAVAALAPVVRGELPLVITANRMDDILTALRIGQESGIRIIIEGGAHAWRIKDRLAALKVPVLLGPKNDLGLTVETGGARHENAALLQEAGVKIAFQTGGLQDLGSLLPTVQAAVRYGLAPEAALRALTINAAEIFGVDDRLGSLEKGKYADIVIFDNDPILATARVQTVIVKGKVVAGAKEREP
jgi:imidazolonepropionase-like amidohydrolase